MNPGQLNKRITIQQESATQNSFGEPTGTWSDIATVWASINPIVGKEYFAAETVKSEVSHKIKIRYKAGITPDMRVKFGSRYFQIIGPPINFKEQNVELQLMCKELI